MAYNSRAEQLLELIAVQMFGHLTNGASRDKLLQINDDTGWNIHIRWFDATYRSTSHYDAISGIRLSAAFFQLAYIQAMELREAMKRDA